MCMPGGEKRKRRPKDSTFTRLLIRLIEERPELIRFGAPEESSAGVATILISDPKLLESVLGIYFRHGRYTSFQRQLNNFGFTKLDKSAGPMNSIYHKIKGPPIYTLHEILKCRPIATPRRRAKPATPPDTSIMTNEDDTTETLCNLLERTGHDHEFHLEANNTTSVRPQQQQALEEAHDDGRVEEHWKLFGDATTTKDDHVYRGLSFIQKEGAAPAAVPAPDLPIRIPPLLEAEVPLLLGPPCEAHGFEPSVQYTEEQPAPLPPPASSFFNLAKPLEPLEDLRMYPGAIVPGRVAPLGPPSPSNDSDIHIAPAAAAPLLNKNTTRRRTFVEAKLKSKSSVKKRIKHTNAHMMEKHIIDSPKFYHTVSIQTFQRMKRELFLIIAEKSKKQVTHSTPYEKNSDHHIISAPYLDDTKLHEFLKDEDLDFSNDDDLPTADIFFSPSSSLLGFPSTKNSPMDCDLNFGTSTFFTEDLLVW